MEYVGIGLLALTLVFGALIFLTMIQAKDMARQARDMNKEILQILKTRDSQKSGDSSSPAGQSPEEKEQPQGETEKDQQTD